MRGDYKNSGLVKSPKVVEIGKQEANRLLDEHHYLGGVRTATKWLGHGEGCTVWGVMRSRTWHEKLVKAGFNPIELVRMVGVEDHTWATSSMLAQSVKWLMANTGHDTFVTYADPMQGHNGSVYLAANWLRLPQDAQPDGFVWRLDGEIVSRKRFYAELGTSAIGKVREVYGERITLEPDVPKKRFCFVRDMRRMEEFITTSKKVKTWGAARSFALAQKVL